MRGAAFAEHAVARASCRAPGRCSLKGIEEAAEAPRPLAAADMVLVRLCHAADLPTPDEALRMLRRQRRRRRAPGPAGRQPHWRDEAARAVRLRPHPARASALRDAVGAHALQAAPEPQPEAAPSGPTLRSFDDVIARARAERDRLLVFALERHVRPVRFEPGQIEIALTPDAEPDLPQRLGAGAAGLDRQALDGRRQPGGGRARRCTRRGSGAAPR